MTPELAEALLRKAIATDETVTFDEVLIELGAGFATAFESEHTLQIVKLLDHPNGDRECYVAYGACEKGRVREMRHVLHHEVEKFARMNGADFIEFNARPQALRLLASYGYERVGIYDDDTIILRKELV